MAKDGEAELELRLVEQLIRGLRTGHVASIQAHLVAGRHDAAADLLTEVEQGLMNLEGRLQSFLRRPLDG